MALLHSNNGEFLYFAALDGHGFIRTSQLGAGDDIARGRLIPVLEDYELNSVRPSGLSTRAPSTSLPKLRVFLDFLADRLREIQAGRAAVQRRPCRVRSRWSWLAPPGRATGRLPRRGDPHQYTGDPWCVASVVLSVPPGATSPPNQALAWRHRSVTTSQP